MKKPNLLYASPFPPQESGISYYSLNLIAALKNAFELTLLVDGYELADHSLYKEFKVLNYPIDSIDWGSFEYAIYNIGNNPWYHGHIYECALQHPGLVILHEAILYFLTVGLYQDRPDFYERMYRMEGPAAIATIRAMRKEGSHLLRFHDPRRLPCNKELINSGNAFMTHSNYTLRKVQDACDRPVLARKINFIQPIPFAADQMRSRAEFLEAIQVPTDATLVVSVGFVAATKQNHVACRAVRRLNALGAGKVHYLMVGEGSYADEYKDDCIRVTGFVDAKTFQEFLCHADLIVNLRYPSMGETSAGLLDAMSFGRPCVISDDAWFSELPDDVVVKIPAQPESLVEDALFDVMSLFMRNRAAFSQLGMRAVEYIRNEHGAEKIVREIGELLKESKRTRD
jgi:glycosyltransferase involved in cell wall biosynthesis